MRSIILSALLVFWCAAPAAALESDCLAMAGTESRVVPAAFEPASLAKDQVRLTFLGHASFLIESPAGVAAVTDYNDVMRAAAAPDIATMNKAHSTHNSARPEAGIKHLLRGWSPDGGPARHNLIERDMRVRNVSTNIRDWGGGTALYGNSIFIFEMGTLCIAHLGHLHHTLTPEQLAAIGQLDIVLVPVDGAYTMDVPGMIEVLRSLRARLIIPMHYFNQFTLTRFVDRVKGEFPIEESPTNTIVVSQETLPPEPKVLILPGM